MTMRTGDCIKRIERYLTKQGVQPVIVDAQNGEDMAALVTHFNVGENYFINVAEFAEKDELPNLDALINDISKTNRNCFVIGLSSFLKLQGDRAVSGTLRNILALNATGHIVVLTHQCKRYLDFHDRRLPERIWVVDGDEQTPSSLVFASPLLPIPSEATVIHGIEHISKALESGQADKIYVVTSKTRQAYPNSLIPIADYNKAYDAVCQKDAISYNLKEAWGTEDQWSYALQRFANRGSWSEVVDFEFGNHNALEHAFLLYDGLDADKQWLLFIALKLYGAKSNRYLNLAVTKTDDPRDLIKYLYRAILDLNPSDLHFAECYQERKRLLFQIGNPISEVIDYCNVVCSKGKNALYYITDNTKYEKELVISLLDQYAMEFERREIESMLEVVYPDLAQYLAPYRFKYPLLDRYFQEYKYQKVVNRVFPEFSQLVTEQATAREYNAILDPRASLVEDIDRNDAQLYFFDALGVEFLGYIVSICKELGIMANIKICMCELPSITSLNKEFIDVFADTEHQIVSIKELDEIKHHGKDSYNYDRVKTPIHIIRELELIREVLLMIQEKLLKGAISKAVIISDHGASRLAVINETENVWEMVEHGKHSGRCCPKHDLDSQPDYATDAGDYWALANYDRFKGGRPACVEVHGGATLEEIVVPIIELTAMPAKIEVYLMPLNEETSVIGRVPEILYSYKSKAAIKLFSTTKLTNVTLCIDGKYYDGDAQGNYYHVFDLHDLKRAKTYYADVYVCDNLIAEKLPFKLKNAGMMSSSKSIL